MAKASGDKTNYSIDASGKREYRLIHPVSIDSSNTIETISYDFSEITGEDYISAKDSSKPPQMGEAISDSQALALFAMAVRHGGNAVNIDLRDIKAMKGEDVVVMVQLGRHFFLTAVVSGQMRIAKK